MKRILTCTYHGVAWTLLACVGAYMIHDAGAATRKFPYRFETTNQGVALDSALWLAKDETGTTVDSNKHGVFPVNDTLFLQDDVGYQLIRRVLYEGGAAWSLEDVKWMSPTVVSAVATVDEEAIAVIVADSITSQHGAGSYTATGGGDVACQFLVLNSSDSSTPVNGAFVNVNNVDDSFDPTGLNISGRTLGSGTVSFNLGTTGETDSFLVAYYAPGWTFDAWDSIEVVSAPHYDTAYATEFSPTAPSDSFTCNVYGWLADIESSPTWKRRLVTFTLDGQVYDTCNGQNVTDLSREVEVGADGKFEIFLLRCPCLVDRDDENPNYTVEIEGIPQSKTVTVPAAASYELIWKDLDDAD